MGGDIVYTRRRLTSRTDKPHVNLPSQSPSEMAVPNSSTKMTNESKADDKLHIRDSAKSKKLCEHDEVTSEMPSNVLGKRCSFASPDLSLSSAEPKSIQNQRKSVTMGGDIVYKRRRLTSRTDETPVNLHSQSLSVIPGPNSSTKMIKESTLSADNRREAMPVQKNEQQTLANLHSSRPHGVYLHPEQTMNSRAASWSEHELDCLWIGVRRHGNGNWGAMLEDPILRSLALKTPRDLALRWEEERLRLHRNRTVSQAPLTNIQTVSSTSSNGNPRMQLPSLNNGVYMSLLRQVEMESAAKALGTNIQTVPSTSSYGNPRMQLPNPNNGVFMSLLRQVEMESAVKAVGTDNSPLLSIHANMEQEEESSDVCSEDTVSDEYQLIRH